MLQANELLIAALLQWVAPHASLTRACYNIPPPAKGGLPRCPQRTVLDPAVPDPVVLDLSSKMHTDVTDASHASRCPLPARNRERISTAAEINMKSRVLAAAVALALGGFGFATTTPAFAQSAQPSDEAAEIAQLKAQLASLQAKVNELEQR